MLNVIMLNVIMLNVIMLNVVMVNVVMVNVVAPPEVQKRGWRRLDYFSNNYRRIQKF
jgi:hypothetical protein